MSHEVKLHDRICAFCNAEVNPDSVEERTICKYDSGRVIVSLGAYVIGYFLLIPYMHYTSIASMRERELYQLINTAEQVQKAIKCVQQSNCIWFEHGSFVNTRTSPQSVDHCHLHIVPFDRPILPHIDFAKPIKFSSVKEAYKYLMSAKPDSYIFIKDMNDQCFVIHPATIFPSQFIRRLMCDMLGIADKWDWREFLFNDNINKTLSLYAAIQLTTI